jgi:lipopolysaccharide export LptBFGC system permease protein LptF
MSPRRSDYNDFGPEQPRPLDDQETDVRGGEGMWDDGQKTHIPNGEYSDENDITVPGYGSTEKTWVATTPRKSIEAILWAKEGNRRGSWYPIRRGTVIGREEGDLVLDDVKVSKPHAKISVEKGQYFIWDNASTNGTYVNGKRIRGATPLDENDRVKIGDSVFVVKLLEPRKKPAKKTPAKKPASASAKKSTATAAAKKTPAAAPSRKKSTKS